MTFKMKRTITSTLQDLNPVNLRKGEIRIACPFRENHKDGSGKQSMQVNTDKNVYHCFSCQEKGRLTSLLTSKFGLTFLEATELVSILPNADDYLDSYEDVLVEESLDLEEIELDHLLPFDNPPQQFLDRGFSKELLKSFGVGVITMEVGKKVKRKEKVITIPLYQLGKLVGVKYRLLKAKAFWYNDDFERQKFIYNEPEQADFVILVEGETDTWKSITNGYQNTVSTLGTEITQYQAERLGRFDNVYLAFDNDLAGLRATEKAYHLLKNLTEVWFVPYAADDPGDCKKKSWVKGVKNATDYVTYSIEMAIHYEGYTEIQEEISNWYNEKYK